MSVPVLSAVWIVTLHQSRRWRSPSNRACGKGIHRMDSFVRRIEGHRMAAMGLIAAAAVGETDRSRRILHGLDGIVDERRIRIIAVVIDGSTIAEILKFVTVRAVSDAIDRGCQPGRCSRIGRGILQAGVEKNFVVRAAPACRSRHPPRLRRRRSPPRSLQ